jgi:subtilisin family serine protease
MRDRYEQERIAAAERTGFVASVGEPEDGYLHVPNEELGPPPPEPEGIAGSSDPFGVHVYRLDSDDDGLTGAARGAAPHYVFTGEPAYHGGPGGLPQPASAPDQPTGDAGSGRTVAVLDTGLADQPLPWLTQLCQCTPEDYEHAPDANYDGRLDLEAGHGTFIAGIVAMRAPSANILVVRALDGSGFVKQTALLDALARLLDADVDVINLSLGGFTRGDEPPFGLAGALAKFEGTMIVAAAGNAGLNRKFWPAADPHVIAVGALDEDGGKAPFSNDGDWVDLWAPGVGVHAPFWTFSERADSVPDYRDPLSFDGGATWSGTSFAAPRVAGELAALIAERGSQFDSAADAVEALRERFPGPV